MLMVLGSLTGIRMDAYLRVALVLLAFLFGGIMIVFYLDRRAGIYGVSKSPMLLVLSITVDFNIAEFCFMLLILLLLIFRSIGKRSLFKNGLCL